MANQNWAIPTNATDFFGQTDKRLSMEERRPGINKGSDILGPLATPTASLIENLESPTTNFNGDIIVPLNAIGSPDPTKWWIGHNIASPDSRGGRQVLSTFRPVDFPHITMVRGFTYAPEDSTTRFFSDWQQLGKPPVTTQPVANNLSGSVTSNFATAYAPLTGGSGVVFLASASGLTLVSLTINCRGSGSVHCLCGFEVRAGATVGLGTVFQAPVGTVTNYENSYQRIGSTELLEGLTPGATYNIRAMFASNSAGVGVLAAAATIVAAPWP